MRYTIQFTDDLMCLVDDEGDGHDACVVDPSEPDTANGQLTTWAKSYAMDLPGEQRRLDRQLKSMHDDDDGS